jgi:dTDP-4-amino-4,6-dideoxygalactose transaminase
VSNIPPLDLTQQYRSIESEITTAIQEVLASGRYIGGSPVAEFERSFADYLGSAYGVGCNSGTDALYLALRALNLGVGDEVITTPFTFFATAEMISAVGATPVFVDIESQTYNLDLAALEAAITPKTRAVLPVHLFGQPIDLSRLMTIAQNHNLWVIEDCAQATGAKWAGQAVGTWGIIGCFSFFPTKNLGAYGDGGAVVTQDAALASRIRALKEHGSSRRYYHDELGINSRLDALQAAILQVKLRYLDRWNAQRQQVADRYTQLLSSIPGIITPQTPAGATPVWNQYTIRIQACRDNWRESIAPDSGSEELLNCRTWVQDQLKQQGVQTMIYYPIPLHLQVAYQSLGYQPGQLPIAEQVAQEVLSLPIFPELTIEQQNRVIHALKDCV